MESIIHGALAIGLAGMFGWVLTIEPRLRVQQVETDALKELLSSKLEDIKERLARIEKSVNGK